MNAYVLGILWSIGYYVANTGYPYFFLRHKNRYFLEIVKKELNVPSKIYLGKSLTETQYRLKIFHLDISGMEKLGWSPRLDEQRNYPDIHDHRDFIRAYLEIHSSPDTITIKPRGRAYRQPRLRIYGNRIFLEALTEVLAAEVGLGLKKVQKATNLSESSGILYYTSRKELPMLLNYLYPPGIKYFYREFYERLTEILR